MSDWPKIHTSEGIPKGSLLILGTPDPVVLAPGQTEPTIEQLVKGYLAHPRECAMITGIQEASDE